MKRYHISGANAFCGFGKKDSKSEDETDSRPWHATVFSGFAGAVKSVYPLIFPEPQNPSEPCTLKGKGLI